MILKAFDKIINIRKLIALDISLNGWLPITAEFLFSSFGMMALLILVKSFLSVYLFIYLMLVSFNFIPPLVYALIIGNRQNAKKEARVELSKLKRQGPKAIRDYNLQQLIGLIPFTIVILSVLQEIQKF
jgi:hypothetical protein